MNTLKNYYKKTFKKYGPSMKGVGWSKKNKSKKRYKTLLKVLEFSDNKKKISILDVGCGYGELIKHLPKNLNYKYMGIDIVEEMIIYAQNNFQDQNIKFSTMNVSKISKNYDFIVCNGILTLKNNLTEKQMQEFMIKCISIFYKFSKIGFSFNLMSEIVDYKSKMLFYPKMQFLLKFFKRKKISKINIDNKSIKYENFFFVKK